MDWAFLLLVLHKIVFGERWIRWMKRCVSTTSFSVLVNGTPTDFFQSSRSLRREDPLSPYLFVVAMEVHGCLIKKTITKGFLKGC